MSWTGPTHPGVGAPPRPLSVVFANGSNLGTLDGFGRWGTGMSVVSRLCDLFPGLLALAPGCSFRPATTLSCGTGTAGPRCTLPRTGAWRMPAACWPNTAGAWTR